MFIVMHVGTFFVSTVYPQNTCRPIVTIIMSNIKLLTDLQNSFTAGKAVKFAAKQCITLGYISATPTVPRF